MSDPRLDSDALKSDVLESDVKDFYQSMNLDRNVSNQIATGIELAENARRWKQIATYSLVAFAASIALLVGLAVRSDTFHSKDTTPPEMVADLPQPETPDGPTNRQPVIPSETIQPEYQLIAVRSHGDGCPYCSATEKAFAELKQSLKDQSISFQRIDFSDRTSLAKTQQKVDELHLTSLVEGRSETAFLVLANRDGSDVKEFKPSQPINRITTKIIETLGQ